MFKVNNKETRTTHWHHSGVFIVNFEHISNLFLVFLLLTLNIYWEVVTNLFVLDVEKWPIYFEKLAVFKHFVTFSSVCLSC